MIARLLLLAAFTIGLVSTVTAGAPTDPAKPPLWLVQVTFPGLPAEADPQAYTGRVEVTAAGAFVGCAWAAWDREGTDQIRLVPLALGYAVAGRREDIRVEAFGELQRLGGMAVRITPLGGPVIGLQDPR